MRNWQKAIAAAVVASGMIAGGSAQAVPALQLFIEHLNNGNTTFYDTSSDTWAEVGTSGFRLWVIGNTGAINPIKDLRFVSSMDTSLGLNQNVITQFQGTTTAALTDPSNPGSGSFVGITTGDHEYYSFAADASIHTALSLGTEGLAPHGVYGSGRTWFEFALGDMTLTDSPLINAEPGVGGEGPFTGNQSNVPVPVAGQSQINAYDITVFGLPVGAQVHFDVYGWTADDRNNCDAFDGVFLGRTSGPNCVHHTSIESSPNSHDARWEQAGQVPEPWTLALLGTGLLGLAGLRRRRQ